MTNDLAFLSAAQLGDAYKAGRLSPVEVVQASLSAVEAHDATLNAFRLVDADAAIGTARNSEERWRKGEALSHIDGVPASNTALVPDVRWYRVDRYATLGQDPV